MESILEISDGFWESDEEDQDYLKYCKPSLLSMHYPWWSLTRLIISDWSSTLIQLPILSLLTIPQAYPLLIFLNYTTVLHYTLILNFQCIYSHFVIQHLQSMIVLRARVLPSQMALFKWQTMVNINPPHILWQSFEIFRWIANSHKFISIFRTFQYICTDLIWKSIFRIVIWALTCQLMNMPSLFIVWHLV